MTLLSFVIPAHNVDLYIKECLVSILNTASNDFEVIVVDDASTDGTLAILREFDEQDLRMKVLHHSTALGAGMARNAGLAAASGQFVWFVDGDDWLPEGAVETVMRRLHAELDVLYIDYKRAFRDGRVIPSSSEELLHRAPAGVFDFATWPAIVNAHAMPWIKVVRRAFLDDSSIVFPAAWYEDIYFTYRVLLAAKAIEVEPSACYVYRIARPGAFTISSGDHHLSWSDQWRAVLQASTNEPSAVCHVLFRKMVDNGWSVLSSPRLKGRTKREFYRRFAALYREYRMPGQTRSVVLQSDSWTLGRIRLLPGEARAGVNRLLVKLPPRAQRYMTAPLSRLRALRVSRAR